MTTTSKSVAGQRAQSAFERGIVDAAERRLRRPRPARQAAVGRAAVVARAERAERAPRRVRRQPLDDELAHHRDVRGMSADGRGAHHRKPKLARHGGRVDVEIHDDFHVIADEADRRDDDGLDAFGLGLAQRVADVGAEPRLASVRRVVALIDEPPALMLERVADEPAARRELRLVVAAVRHRQRQAVRREQHERVPALLDGQRLERLADAVARRFDERRGGCTARAACRSAARSARRSPLRTDPRDSGGNRCRS